MSRSFYGQSAADFTTDKTGRIRGRITQTVWTTAVGGTQVFDLLDADGTPVTAVTSDADGLVSFQGPDGYHAGLWLDDGDGARLLCRPTVHATGASGTGVNVRDHGAFGDGVTDDTAAIQNAINTAGTGQRVFFPEGIYLISAPIRPLRTQTLEGVYSNKYEAGEFPWGQTNGSILRADPATFNGDSVIHSDPGSYGVTLSRLAIVGPGGDFGSPVHGVYFGSREDAWGERAWTIRDCLINSCSGDGIAGHMWVFDARDVHISQCRAGIATFDDDGMLDSRIIGCNVYFNRDAGIRLAGGYAGAINIIGCRIERSGNLYGYPATPVNPNAPGIEITRAVKVLLSNIDTDSNTGPGLKIGNPDYFIYLITVVNCHFNRDGGGAQTGYESRLWVDVGTPEAPEWEYQIVADGTPGSEKISTEGIPGIDLDDCANVRIVGSQVSYGAANDFDGGILSPQYGIRYNESNNIEIIGTSCNMPVKQWSFKDEDTSYNVSIQAPTEHQLMTLPVAEKAKYLPTFGGIGSVAYQNDLGTIVFRNYNGDWRQVVATDGVNPVRLGRFADLNDNDGLNNSALRIVKGGSDDVNGWGLLRWTVDVNPESTGFTWFLGRYGDDGLGDPEAYIDSPIAVNWSTGRVDLNSTYQQSSDPATAASVTRGAVGQTGNLAEWWNSDADTLAGVRPDGRIFGTEGVAGDDFVTVSQLSGTDVSDVTLVNTDGDGLVRYVINDTLRWGVGHNPAANGNTFYIGRFDASGDFVDDPLSINLTTGRVDLNHAYVRSSDSVSPALVVRGAEDSPALLQEWVSNDSVDGLTTVAGVTGDGRVFGTEGTDPDDYITKGQLEAEVGDYLPLVGGTLTGPVTGTDATFTGTVSLGAKRTSSDDTSPTIAGQQINAYGSQATAFGSGAMLKASNFGATAYGTWAMEFASGTNATAVGYLAMRANSGDYSSAFGFGSQNKALSNIATSPTGHTALPLEAGRVYYVNGVDVQIDGQAISNSYYIGTGTEASITATSGLKLRPNLPPIDNTLTLGAGSWTDQVGGIAIGKDAAATTPNEVQIGTASGAEMPTSLRVGTTKMASEAYVDAAVDDYLPLVGGTLTGNLTVPTVGASVVEAYTDASSGNHTVRKSQLDTLLAAYAPLAGADFTGNVTVAGTVQAAWGSSAYAAVQQGCTQVVRQGASSGNTMFAVYTSTANADADNSVFEVYGSGSVKIGPGKADNEAASVGQAKTIADEKIALATDNPGGLVAQTFATYVANGNGLRSTILTTYGYEVASEVWLEAGEKVSTLSCSVATAGNADSVVRMGLRAADYPNGPSGNRRPGTLIDQVGPIAANTTGVKTGTLASTYTVPESGYYYVCALTQGTATAPTLRSTNTRTNAVRHQNSLATLLGTASVGILEGFSHGAPYINTADPLPSTNTWNTTIAKPPVVVVGLVA